MKYTSRPAILCALVCGLSGCQAGPTELSKADDAKLRTQLGAKFDINNVPPDKREMVKAMMEANAKGNAPKSAPPSKK
jgi:hypothetical protein